jgi:hypothetical protein
MKQIEVINLETIIDVTAETSNVEILVQDYDSELAERFALEAQESAIDAEESADIATAQASIATAQAGIATTQAGIATTQAGNALTSANNAAASAQEAQDIVDSIITADLTEATSSVLTITGGTDAVLGTGTTIQVKQAGSSQSGFLSSTDWTTFNSKQNTITNPVTGTGASGQVAFWNGTSSQTGDNGLFWDNTNKRLGVGTTTPSQAIDVSGNIKLNNSSQLMWRNAANNADIPILQLTNSNILNIGTASSSIPSSIILHANSVAYLRLFSTGNIILQNGGTFTDAGFRLDVNGTVRTGTLRLSNTSDTLEFANTLVRIVRPANNRMRFDAFGGFEFLDTNASITRLLIPSTGNVLINTTTDAGFRLDVNGTARVQGVLNVSTGGAAIVGNTSIRSGQEGLRLGGDNNGQILSNNTDKRGRISVPQYGSTTGLPIGIILGATNVSSNSVQIGGIQGGYTLAADSIEFFVGATYNATTSNQIARFFSTGNFTLQNGGTFTDAGFRLDVNGTARVQGAATITGVTRIGNSSYNDVTLSGLVVGINGSSASRVTIANNGNYQDVQFIATAISSGNINTWSFGQRRDTFFGNTIGSFQIVGSYTDNAGAGAPVGGGYRVPLICNPNGDVIIAGASANAINGNLGIGTVTPTFKLDVNGTARVQGDATITGNLTVDTNSLFVNATNNRIGIGTITPAVTFDVVGTHTSGTGMARFTGSSVSGFMSLDTTSTGESGFLLKSSNTLIGQVGTDGNLNELYFKNRIFGDIKVLTINSSGNLVISNSSNVLIGTTTDVASSKLTIESTTQGFLPPRMTTTQRNAIASPATGLMIYNSTDNLVQAYNGTSWINL